MPVNQTAKTVADALAAGAGLKAAADALYAEIGSVGDRATIFDIGPGADGYLVAWPGYTPLSDPRNFLKLATLM